jgi:N-acyl-D-aspartate/D-glutamate deacylase
MTVLDLVVRNALVHDGSGMPAYRGEVGVRGGRIVAVGRVPERGEQEIDARGLALAPGFVDVHTHYDAQINWDGQARPALEHGVTTVVTGNCSLTVAPLRAEQRDRLCRMFRQIEDLPMAAFDEGIDWTWESFDEWLASLRGKLAINLAPLVGHSALRMWVMGEDAFHREATEDEVEQLCQLLREALAAGASGLSTSYIDVDDRYKPVPSRLASHDELRALARTLGEEGRGVLQIVHEFFDASLTCQRIDMLADLTLEFGITTTLSPLFHSAQTPDLVPTVLAKVAEVAAKGARVWPQVQTRPLDVNFRLRERNFALAALPTWAKVFSNRNTHEDRVAMFSDPETQAKLIAEAYPEGEGAMLSAMRRRLERAFVRGVAKPEHEHLVGRSLGELAAERGQNPAKVMIDLSLDEDLQTEFKNENLGHLDPEVVGEMLAHPNVLIGASDAGAHVQAFSTNGDTGYLFSRFVREHPAMTTEHAVRRITHEAARAWGLQDRGLLHPGYAADLVLFDPATIDRDEEIGVADLPGDGYRYLRHSIGVDTVIVNGAVAWTSEGGYTDARTGTVVSQGVPG